MRYLPHTEADRAGMLGKIGVDSIDDLFVDIPAEEGRRRRGAVHDRLEAEADDYHEAVRQHFLAMAAGHPERYLVVDGTWPPEEIHREIHRACTVRGWLPA